MCVFFNLPFTLFYNLECKPDVVNIWILTCGAGAARAPPVRAGPETNQLPLTCTATKSPLIRVWSVSVVLAPRVTDHATAPSSAATLKEHDSVTCTRTCSAKDEGTCTDAVGGNQFFKSNERARSTTTTWSGYAPRAANHTGKPMHQSTDVCQETRIRAGMRVCGVRERTAATSTMSRLRPVSTSADRTDTA